MSRMHYRPEVDGLRALAVIPVILFHAGFQQFNGGYVGVDVFFVISGYLITGIILAEKESGSFTIAGFYERRVRRILPALFLVTFACILAAWWWMLPNELRNFGQSVVSVSVFLSNVYFWLKSGYFSAASEEMPLLHTWSLAVEEQFYVVFPLFLSLLWMLGRRWLVGLTVVGIAVSLALAEWGSRVEPSANFYLAPFRAWELLIGSLVAWHLHGRPRAPGTGAPALKEALALSGLLLILYSVAAFDHETPFPSLHGLIPVGGVALVLLWADGSSFTGRLLSTKALVGMGLISYSAYLWHQPLFAFARLKGVAAPSAAVLWALVLATIVLAFLTWKYVEQPFRNRAFLTRRRLFLGAAGGTAVLMALGFLFHRGGGFPGRIDEEVLRYYSARYAYSERRDQCISSPAKLLLGADACTWGRAGARPTIAIWGDSHASVIAEALGGRVAAAGRSVALYSYTGCPSILGVSHRRRAGRNSCSEFIQGAYDSIVKNPAIETVVLLSRWPLYFEGSIKDGPRATWIPDLYPREPVSSERERREAVARQLHQTVRALLDAGKKVILVYPIPEPVNSIPEYLAKRAGAKMEIDAPIPHADYTRRNELVRGMLDGIADHPGLSRAYPEKVFCNRARSGVCETIVGSDVLYYDASHLTLSGGDLLAGHIVELLRAR